MKLQKQILSLKSNTRYKKTVQPIMVVQFFVLYTMFARPNIIRIAQFEP